MLRSKYLNDMKDSIYKISVPMSSLPDYEVNKDGVVEIKEDYKIIGSFQNNPDYKLVYIIIFEDGRQIEIDGCTQSIIIYLKKQIREELEI